jgi:O-antigen ligase
LFYVYTNAHSNYFQLLSDLGIAGPVLFLMILLIPLITVVRRTISNSDRRLWMAPALALALIALLLSSLTQTWIADSRVYITAWFIALVAGSELVLVPHIDRVSTATPKRGRLEGKESRGVEAEPLT